MTFTPLLAHGGGVFVLVRVAVVLFFIGTLLVTGLCVAHASKTNTRWLIGAGLCLVSVTLLIVFLSDPGGISSRLIQLK